MPWVNNGCFGPALGITGLNDTFCPGLTPVPQNQLTVEEGTFANHGVYPVQPRLEHFKCYKLKRNPQFQPTTADLSDQFGSRATDVVSRGELCNPARSNQEPFVNKRAHLQCYAAPGPDVDRDVIVRNQFGSQRLRVHEAQRLCLPSHKRELPNGQFGSLDPLQLDHLQCYGVDETAPIESANPIKKVDIKDQFGTEPKVKIGRPIRLCAPVTKTHNAQTFPANHPVGHLVCYRIRDARKARKFEINNQFEQTKLQTTRPTSFCVPSAKYALP